MQRKDCLLVGCLLGVLCLLAVTGIFYVHFQGEDRTEKERKSPSGQTIRVLLSTSDFSGIFHEQVQISAADGCRVIWEDGEDQLDKGEVWSAEAFFQAHTAAPLCRFIPENEGTVTLQSVSRNGGAPEYEGCMEVRRTSQGFVVISELPLEAYLRHVVPSEMPASFGQEPLKAQAICARNFAYQHMQNPAYIDFDADLDDSIRFQVYNNSPANEETDRAIRATEGQLLVYNGSIVDAYYYSTSWGYTTDLSLWGGESAPYYLSHWQGDGEKTPDLTDESTFRKTLEEEKDAYECKDAWYRWSVTLPKERILENLKEIEMADLNSLTDIAITARRAGGSVRELVLMGDGKTLTLTRESEIRQTFLPSHEQITRNDGSVLDGYEKLPSSFFTIDKNVENGELVSVTVRGGGCGHGIGMSQNCAKALGNRGKTCEEILQYFYPGTSVEASGVSA